MLVLMAKVGSADHEIFIGENIKIRILSSSDGYARVGIDAPHDMEILRGKVRNKIIDKRKRSDNLNNLKDIPRHNVLLY